jgi:hypothetical protein
MMRILPFGKVTFTIVESITDEDWHAANSIVNMVVIVVL